MHRRQLMLSAAGAALVPLTARAADEYPSRAIRFVVNNAPGGAADSMARTIAQRLADIFGQPMTIENKPGNVVGMQYVSHQPGDGYTVTMGTFSQVVGMPLLTKVPYDMARDFTSLSIVASAPSIMVVPVNAPYKDLAQFLAAARVRPDAFNYGSGGIGTLAFLSSESINVAANLRMQNVPYKATLESINALLAGDLNMVITNPLPVMSHIRGGKLRPIAATSAQRLALLPDVPTFAESGFPELVCEEPYGMFMPRGVPPAIVARFTAALRQVMESAEVQKRLSDSGVDAKFSTPEELDRMLVSETERYRKVIQARNIKAV